MFITSMRSLAQKTIQSGYFTATKSFPTNISNLWRAFSTNASHMPIGSPSTEIIKPGHPEYKLFRHNLRSDSYKEDLFQTTKQDALDQLHTNTKKDLTQMFQKSSKLIKKLSGQVYNLKKRVEYLEAHTHKN